MALTDIQIKRAKPQDKPYKLNDGQGLSLLINPDGSKGWRFRFRFAGKARLMSFGCYDLVSLAETREKRDTARKQVASAGTANLNRELIRSHMSRMARQQS